MLEPTSFFHFLIAKYVVSLYSGLHSNFFFIFVGCILFRLSLLTFYGSVNRNWYFLNALHFIPITYPVHVSAPSDGLYTLVISYGAIFLQHTVIPLNIPYLNDVLLLILKVAVLKSSSPNSSSLFRAHVLLRTVSCTLLLYRTSVQSGESPRHVWL
jgi:hypothetical protein